MVLHGFNNTNTFQVNGIGTALLNNYTSLLIPIKETDTNNATEGRKTLTTVVKNSSEK